jgi:tripartite ATP-independent transporter DctM subunit
VPAELLGPFMFVVAFGLLFAGYPVAFTLAGTALLFALSASTSGHFDLALLHAFPSRVNGVLSNPVLLAIPSFIFMGTLLEKARLAEDLLTTIGGLFGRVRGGLALGVVLVGTLLAAATGVVGASVVAMGLISMPVMLRHGYSPRFAAGVIAASGTLGQLIPPSVVLVVLGDQLGVSVSDLFVGALVPGLLLAGAYALWVLILAAARPDVAPALPPEARPVDLRAALGQVTRVLVPPALLILLVLGSIFVGFATPTEAGAVGAAGALGLAAAHGRLRPEVLAATVHETARLSTMVVFLLIGSTLFALVFRGLGGDLWMEDQLTRLPGGAFGLVLVLQLVVFLLGFFIDFFEIAFIVLPLLVPAARLLGVDLVWLGVLLAINLQTSFLTPPFGFSLFYLRGVAPPEVRTADIYRGAVPFIVIQLLVLGLVWAFPGLVSGG